MPRLRNALLLIVCCAAIFAQDEGSVSTGPVEAAGQLLRFTVDSARGAAITNLEFVAAPHNLSSHAGLLLEGFGVASPYTPNRRVNESVRVIDGEAGPTIVYEYDGEGPNITGLHVTRTITFDRTRSSIEVSWRIEDKGDEAHWVAPWVRCLVAPGGTVDVLDRIDMPTPRGILQPDTNHFAPASRNWIAATDTAAHETVYGVFDAEKLHSFEAARAIDAGELGFGAHFVPFAMAKGDVWETSYVIAAVRGLDHVDFATDELAAQLDHGEGKLALLLSSATLLPEAHTRAVVTAPDGTNATMKVKRLVLAPDHLVRCTYEWQPAGDGLYEFLAKFETPGGSTVPLGALSKPPHPGIDTAFIVGNAANAALEPWSDAPHALDREGRTLKRALAVNGPVLAWFEGPLEKLFRDDNVIATEETATSAQVWLARNERESLQLALRLPEGAPATKAYLQVTGFEDPATGHTFAADFVSMRRVDYLPVAVPTHFENVTGAFPDPLPTANSFPLEPGVTQPVWLTFHAPEGTPPGEYHGPLQLLLENGESFDLSLDITVWDFTLPEVPALRTDFEYDPESALLWCTLKGYGGALAPLNQRYLDNALEHRVTLRQLVQAPPPGEGYSSALSKHAQVLHNNRGISSVYFSPELLANPEAAAMASEHVTRTQSTGKAFTVLAEGAPAAEWEAIAQRAKQWTLAAPNIAPAVMSWGLTPFLAQDAPLWLLHSRVFDTPANRNILNGIASGRRVWWYVNHMPPRPYANFFVDFAAIEHRILFWQSWALGVEGVHYWSINHTEPRQDPYLSLLDVTPANGDGFLVYPGPDGPVNSIRWETIRDGIEDFDYLVIARSLIVELEKSAANPALLEQAKAVMNLGNVVPDLTTFTRDHKALEQKRREIGALIPELRKAAGK